MQKKNIYSISQQEMQLGRHVAFSNTIYSLYGLWSLNLFNCQEIIEDWMLLEETYRQKNKPFHSAIIKELYPELLNYSFNPLLKEKKGLQSRIFIQIIYALKGLIESYVCKK